MIPQLLLSSIAKIVDLSAADLSLLLSCVTRRELKKGEVLLEEGKVCRSLYFVENGYLRTYYNKEGTDINLNFTFEGDFASNLKSFQSRQPSQSAIEAGEQATVWVFKIDTISGQFSQSPQVTRFIRRVAMRMLLASEEHSNLFRIYTPAERYEYIEKNKPALLQRISLSQMASYLGVKRETLSRIRGRGR